MRLSDSGRRLIKGFEGLSLKAYKDANGYSIGYGHFGAKPGDTITAAVADSLFDSDVERFERAVSEAIPLATQEQFDACTSLAYNIGTAAFKASTLARMHNGGDYYGAAGQFARWNKSQGSVHPGLVVRRAKERAVYEGQGYPSTGSGGYGSGPAVGSGIAGVLAGSGIGVPASAPPAQPPTVPPPPPRPGVRKAAGSGGWIGVFAAVFFCPGL